MTDRLMSVCRFQSALEAQSQGKRALQTAQQIEATHSGQLQKIHVDLDTLRKGEKQLVQVCLTTLSQPASLKLTRTSLLS